MKPDPTRGVRRRTLSWWWRRNPMRSRSHLVEGWALLGVGVLAVVGGAAAGVAAGRCVLQSTDRQRGERHQVVAVLTADPYHTSGYVSEPRAQLAWTSPAGAGGTGETRVAGGLHRGDHLTVWIDRRDRIAPAPLSMDAARVEGVFLGTAAATGAGGLAIVAGAVGTHLAGRRRDERWAAEWAEVGPRWDRHTA